ncbi:hypothetical protein ABZ070_03265 [Streptomyces sp. NPDC006283]
MKSERALPGAAAHVAVRAVLPRTTVPDERCAVQASDIRRGSGT